MSHYWSSVVHQLTPYVPGEQPKLPKLVKLNTNESPYPPSPRVVAAIADELANAGERLRLYPDPDALALREALAARYKLRPRQVFVGNGSDEVLAHVFLALFKQPQPILFPDVSYSFYPVYCSLYGIAWQAVPVDQDLAIRLDDYAAPNGGIIVAHPNAPTGCALSLAAIETLLQRNTESVVVIDEAYVDFGAESAVALVDRHPNLLVVQTFSKSRSLAGLRVGFALGHPDLIEGLDRVKNSFNSYPLDRLAIAGALAALADEAYFDKTRQAVIRSREELRQSLLTLGFEILPSAANFLFIRHPQRDAGDLAAALRQRDIVVRHFRLPRVDQHLRITVGTDSQCQTLVDALRAILDGVTAV